MIPKRFEDIDFTDLETLLNNQVAEGKTIEYKKEIVSNANSDKVPFLAGVSAFANTIGGDFIIGIEAKKGIPVSLTGLTINDVDAEQQRIEQILQNGLEPRLPSVNVKIITSPNNENFVFIRANQSWIAPHKVKENEKFYGRNSVGKYPFDVSELRTAFMLTEQLSEKIRDFHQQRLNRISNNEETPTLLRDGGKVILHLLPLSSFTNPLAFDIKELLKKIQFSPISADSWGKRINLDGVIVEKASDQANNSYTQVFRNGCIEAVNCLSWDENDRDFSARFDEGQIIDALTSYLKFYRELGIELPIYLFLSFIDVKGYKFHLDDDFHRVPEIRYTRRRNTPVIDRNNLLIPETTIENYNLSASEIIRPSFDLVWNSVGFVRDFNYDNDGKWIDNFRNFYSS